MRTVYFAAALITMILLTGCDAALVPATKDPARKLLNAETLQQQNRPLPAERFIRESIDMYKQKNDEQGLAMAYRDYGYLLDSDAVNRWEYVYRRDGFIDKTVTFDNRKEKSIEYFELARALFAKQRNYVELTNVDINGGWVNERIKRMKQACEAYDRTLEDYHHAIAVDPKVPMHIPSTFATFEDYVAAQKKRAGCSSTH